MLRVIAGLVACLLVCWSASSARERDTVARFLCPQVCLGVSSGINNPYGLMGLSAEVVLFENTVVGAGAGFSTWGTKMGGEVRYHLFSCLEGFAVGGGFTHNTGVGSSQMVLRTVRGEQQVDLALQPKSNLFLAAHYYGRIGRGRSRFHLAAGYSFGLGETEYRNNSAYVLTDKADKAVRLLAPGGPLLSIGLHFGLLLRKQQP